MGLGALKYFILKVDARKNMLFNPEESIDFNGNTGPFIQYTYARIRSILRKAQAEGISIPTTLEGTMPLNEKEIELIQKLNEFGAAVEQAGKDYSPSGIANYCYELTKAFNQFYHDYSILGADTEEEKVVRLVLAQNVGKTLKNGMALLGIEVPGAHVIGAFNNKKCDGHSSEYDRTAFAAHRINQDKATLSIGKRGFFVGGCSTKIRC